jgi:hypothetical protein
MSQQEEHVPPQIEKPKKSNLHSRKKAKRNTKCEREDSVNTLKQHAREYVFQYNPQIIDLTKNAEECKRATTGVCLRPDIFLNNNRSCHNCAIYEHCACSSKHIDKKFLKKAK